MKSLLSEYVPNTFEELVAQELSAGDTFCVGILNLILIEKLWGVCGVLVNSHPLAIVLYCRAPQGSSASHRAGRPKQDSFINSE